MNLGTVRFPRDGHGWLLLLAAALVLPTSAQADLQILAGSCGELDTELTDASPHLFTTRVGVTECDYVAAGLSAGGLEILQDDNLGGSSLYSEILVHELAYECDDALLLKTEGEIVYDDANGKKTDLLLEIEGTKIGVSVTRAIVYPPGTPLDPLTAETLLEDKLQDVILSSANVSAEDQWAKQILVIEMPDAASLSLMVDTYATTDEALKADTIVWMVDTDGEDDFLYFGPEPECDGTAVVASTVPVPVRSRNFPNPFNPATTIELELRSPATVTVTIHDLAGRLVRRLIEEEGLDARVHRRRWDGRDAAGAEVGSGVYLLRVDAGGHRTTHRMALLR